MGVGSRSLDREIIQRHNQSAELLKWSDHTMARLLGHLSLRGQFNNVLFPGSTVLDSWIEQDIEELKIAIMTNCFDQMRWFVLELKADQFDESDDHYSTAEFNQIRQETI